MVPCLSFSSEAHGRQRAGACQGGVCACAMGGGGTILKRETRMGPGPPWSPEAPPESVHRTVCAPSRQAPAGVAAGGLALVRTSGGVGLCDLRPGAPMPGRVMQLHSRPLRGGHGGGNYNRSGCNPPPSYLSKLAGVGGGVLAAWPGGGAARDPLLPHGGGGSHTRTGPAPPPWRGGGGVRVSPSSLEGLAPPCDGAVASNTCV